MHFNSHAHVERDWNTQTAGGKLEISTHTLTWSVTFVAGIRVHTHFISTHTLTWSVTMRSNWVSNSTMISTHTLTWSVTKLQRQLLRQAGISTHTLTWSVTNMEPQNNHLASHFNSHAHVERDINLSSIYKS